MGRTKLTTNEIGSVQRNDFDITTTGQAVITKVIAGTNIAFSSSTGVDAGTGDVTITLATTPTITLTNSTGLPLTTGVTGILPIANGGTNSNAVISTPAATSWAGWDANKNLSANNWINSYTTTVTAAATTTLTVASTYQQNFTGTTTQTVTMPVVSTLVLGTQYLITNNSTGTVTVNSSGGNAIISLLGGTSAILTSNATTGTAASVWYASYSGNVKYSKGINFSAPTATENAMMYFTPVALTITNVQEALAGTTPSVTYAISYGSARNAATSTIVASHAATSTTGAAATLNVTTIPANSYIWITTSATSGTVTDFHVTIIFTQ